MYIRTPPFNVMYCYVIWCDVGVLQFCWSVARKIAPPIPLIKGRKTDLWQPCFSLFPARLKHGIGGTTVLVLLHAGMPRRTWCVATSFSYLGARPCGQASKHSLCQCLYVFGGRRWEKRTQNFEMHLESN